jgi:DNA-binding response OmpR family regulator
MARILVAEDDPKQAELIRRYAVAEGHEVTVVHDGRAAVDEVRRRPPDLLILDVMMPRLDGLDVTRILRGSPEYEAVPILILTARASEDDLLDGLDLGADDYLTKPFSPRELVLRVQAILRRGRRSDDELLSGPASFGQGELVIDNAQRQVTVRGEVIELTPTEWGVLTALAQTPGRVYSRYELINRVRGYEYDGYERTVDSHVKNLRRKIEASPRSPTIVVTVLGGGYRLGLRRDG